MIESRERALEGRDRQAAERERLLAEREKVLDARGAPLTSGADDCNSDSRPGSRTRTPLVGAVQPRGPTPPPLALAPKAGAPGGSGVFGDKVASWSSLQAAASGGSGGGIRRAASIASMDFCSASDQGDEAAEDGLTARSPRRNASLSGVTDSSVLSGIFSQVYRGVGAEGGRRGRVFSG